MTPNAAATMSARRQSGFDRGAAVSRSLLGYGVLAGPFYLAVGLAQAAFREGFDFRRHALSHLANGHLGWIQSVNFLLSGLMVVAAAVGVARIGGREFRLTSRLVGAYGTAVFLAGIFRADPVPGLPPGTPENAAATMSTRGMLHFLVGGLGFVALAVGCLLAARGFARRGSNTGSRLSLVAGLVVVAGFFGPGYLPSVPAAMAALWVSVVVGWAWLAATSIYLYRASPSPNC